MAAPAAPAAVEVGYVAIGLGVLLTFCVLLGLHRGYQYTLGALLVKLADLTGGFPLIGGKLEDAISAANHFVLDTIADALEATEGLVAKWWYGQMWIIHQLGDTLRGFANDTYTTIDSLVTVTIPAIAGATAKPLGQQLAQVKRSIRAYVNDELARLSRGIDSLTRDLNLEKLRSLRGIDELAGRLRANVRALRDYVTGEVAAAQRYARGALTRRVGNLERALAAGVIGGVALATLTRVFPWWRCTNVRSFNRMLCRSPVGAIDDLLGLALTVVGPISILELARVLQTGTGFAASAVNEWVMED